MASYPSHHSGHSRGPFSKAEPPMPLSTPQQDPLQQQQDNQPPAHKRVYQACIPCRRRKVRCDLGSVDNPHEPPCVRCRRESKHCFFSATRRKRKADDGEEQSDAEDEYIQRNGRKRHQPSGSPSVNQYNDGPLTPGGSVGRSQPLRPPFESSSRSTHSASRRGPDNFGGIEGEPNTPLENLEARTVMRREVYGPHDALELLYKAATDNPHTQNGINDSGRLVDHRQQPSLMSPRERGSQPTPLQVNNNMGQDDPPIDPQIQEINAPAPTSRSIADEPGYAEALKTWTRFRFVRAGWFTAQEAIEYIDYYYTFLSPLTPISPPTFKTPASQVTLLTEEPILTVTLLTIASRYRSLPGPGGHCRSHAIHEQLWTYLRGMIERVVWGQEAFGGGFCGSGADTNQSSSTSPSRGMRKGSLRTLGTIESLMILTEWHPRALHFPPSEAIDELLLPTFDAQGDILKGDGAPRPIAGGGGGKRIESWLEPAWRSDRMCWMLLSTAMGLAYELGVFDDIEELLATRPEYEDEPYRLRAHRIKKLLLIYMTQLAGRLGWTSMVPESLRKSDRGVSRRRNGAGFEGTTPGTNPSSLSTGFNYVPDLDLDDCIIVCWEGISDAMHTGNEKLFRSRQYTTDIIQSGKYVALVKEFHPLLADWKRNFDSLTMLPAHIKTILLIEYEYVRIYVNSLSLQAVVERCTNNAEKTAANNSGATQLSPQTTNYLGKLPLGHFGGFGAADKEYVKEVIDGSRSMLKAVVDGLLPKGYLKHAPVRTYFRIISGAMFLLKTFALGAPKADIEESILLVDRSVDALRDCVVDDVHLGKRFADLLESLTSRLRNKFIHAPAQTQSHDDRSPAPNQGEPGLVPNGSHPALDAMQFGGKLVERTSTPANVSATPFDHSAGVFPYPPGSATMYGPSTPANTSGIDGAGMMDGMFSDGAPEWNNNEMWYLPTGSAFFNIAGAGDTNVAMTAEGVNVGGLDLLEYMMMDGTQTGGNGAYGADGSNY